MSQVRVLLGNVYVSDARSSAWSNKKKDAVSTKEVVETGKWDSLEVSMLSMVAGVCPFPRNLACGGQSK
jgi:hypothetical protein